MLEFSYSYDGTVTLYQWDKQDPVLQTWMKAFPDIVTPLDKMSPSLLEHVRYPQDIFKVQRTILSRYHVTDAATFYNGTDVWIVPFDPTLNPAQVFQPPYYLTLQMPGDTKPEFSLTTAFAPQRRQTLAAFMQVNSDPGENYGQMQVLQLPSNTTIPGPQQVQNNFESDPTVSSQLSLLRRGGSEVELGNLLSLPFNDGLLYVEPVYIRATTDGYPLLRIGDMPKVEVHIVPSNSAPTGIGEPGVPPLAPAVANAIAAATGRPGAVIGLHFFNPVPLMKIVEIVKSSFTDENTIVDLTTFVNLLGHKSILTKDTPGFVINHAGRGYVTEAMRVLTEGTAPFYEIDRILKDTAGFRMGPCELLDLTALDVSHPVMESIYEQFYHDPRYKPQPITRQMLAAGHVGRKAGKGFYTYVDGKQETFPEQEFEHIEEPLVFTSDAMIASMLHGMKCMFNNPNNNSNADVILTGPMGTDATTEAIGKFIDPTRAVAVDMIGDMSKRVVLMTNPKTTPRAIAAAVSAFKQFGRQVSVIRDSSGFVTQRVLATIINIACEIAQQGIASPADIDLAVKLGLGYPKGPLEWGNAIGAKQVLRILENLQQQTGDDRYRPCPWLRRRAQLGLSLLAQEQ